MGRPESKRAATNHFYHETEEDVLEGIARWRRRRQRGARRSWTSSLVKKQVVFGASFFANSLQLSQLVKSQGRSRVEAHHGVLAFLLAASGHDVISIGT